MIDPVQMENHATRMEFQMSKIQVRPFSCLVFFSIFVRIIKDVGVNSLKPALNEDEMMSVKSVKRLFTLRL